MATSPDLETDYDNLLYACIPCNLAKGSSVTPDPLSVLTASDVSVTENGAIRGASPEAARLIELIGLDRPRAAEFRELWIGIVRLAATFDPALFGRLMGYPADLPDLSALEPPDGNTRPDGVTASHFERHKAGTLPVTY